MYSIEGVKSELPYYQEILLFYKINPCPTVPKSNGELFPITHNCNQIFCFHYHNLSERRRPVFNDDFSGTVYQPVKCSSLVENSICGNGEFCKFSHTQNEIDYHPLFYKTEPCQGCFYETNPKFCPYYHPDEISRKIVMEKFIAKMNKETSKTQTSISNLDNFKAKQCPLKGNHNPKMCEYYHHDQDRKRPVGIYQYSPNLCRFLSEDKSCPNGDHCRFAHNKVEQLYHPERYKKKFCLSHPHNVYKCDYGNYCSFAHGENEIQVELLHNLKKDENFYLYKYKTVFCPYIYEHDRNQCVYAHNPQDYRRDPKIHSYDPVQCPYWSQGQIYSYEESGCPNQMQCEHCHGWKEMEYHPMYYKTKPCNNGKKCNKKDCPFFHNTSEKREVPAGSQISQNLQGPQGSVNVVNSQKNVTNFLENDFNVNFEAPKSKFAKKKESNYSRPVIPNMPNYIMVPNFNPQQEMFQAKPKQRFGESSTRPNSNISSVQFNPEEEYCQPIEKAKKKKIKGMSLQTQMEKSKSPPSAKSDKPQVNFLRPFKGSQGSQGWEPMKQGGQDDFNELMLAFETSKPFSESKVNESFESLESYTVEKNVAVSDKPSEASNSQFMKTLIMNLEKKGLDNVAQCLKSGNVEVEVLRSFNQKNFGLFPQISWEDKEKVVKIIQDIEEGEDIFSKINTIHGEPMGGAVEAQGNVEETSVLGNLGKSEDKDDFNGSGFFQRYTY